MLDKVDKIAKYIVYLVLIGIILYLILKPLPVPEPQKVTVVLKYDSIPKTINTSTIEKPVIIKPGDINLPQSVIQILSNPVIDTTLLKEIYKKLAKDYYAEYVQHTQTADTNIIIDTWDTITENNIRNRKLQYKFLKPIAQTTTITNPERFKGYVGLGVQAGTSGFNYAGPEISFTTKEGYLFTIGYNALDLLNGQDKYSFKAGIAKKISFRKK